MWRCSSRCAAPRACSACRSAIPTTAKACGHRAGPARGVEADDVQLHALVCHVDRQLQRLQRPAAMTQTLVVALKQMMPDPRARSACRSATPATAKAYGHHAGADRGVEADNDQLYAHVLHVHQQPQRLRRPAVITQALIVALKHMMFISTHTFCMSISNSSDCKGLWPSRRR